MVSDNALVRSAALCSADCVRANVQGDIGVGTVVLDAHLFVSTDPHKLRTDMLPSPKTSAVQWNAPRPRAAQGSGDDGQRGEEHHKFIGHG